MKKHGLILLWASAVFVLIACLFHVAVTIPCNGGLGHVEGTWIALGMDLADGVFYRPLVGDHGYGGTRFMPLCFSLHGALIYAGLPVLGAGYAIAIASTLLLLAGVYRLLSALDVGWELAVPCALLVLGFPPVYQGIVRIRGDMLPAALNVWGLVFCVAATRHEERRGVIPIAALCFALAFFGKVTTVFGFAAALLSLFFSGRKDQALKLAGMTLGCLLLAAGIVLVASRGQAWTSMAACASGGATVSGAVRGPVRMVQSICNNSALLILGVLAGAALLSMPGRCWREIPTTALLCTAAATAVIFGSPGTAANHLLDLCPIGLAFLALRVRRGDLPTAFGAAVLALMAAIAGVGLCRRAADRFRNPEHPYDAVAREFAAFEGTMLSESPLLPVLLNRRPYLLDAFMFRQIVSTRPERGALMKRMLSERRFDVIVLMNDPETGEFRQNFTQVRPWEAFLAGLSADYGRAEEHGRFVVYRPRDRHE